MPFSFVLVAAWLAGMGCLLPGLARSQDSGGQPVQAIWKEHDLTFHFQSFTTFYSCSSLETKVRRVLKAVGADRGLKLRTRGCTGPNHIARLPAVDITVLSAIEATPDALAEQESTRSKRELIARARGELDEAREAELPFAAEWREISFAKGKHRLDPGDCELIDQLQKKIFPQLGVRVVADNLRCLPHQAATESPRLVVKALFALPRPDDPPVEN